MCDFAAFVVWAGAELTSFASHIVKQVFVPQSPISTLAECVSTIRNQCEQVSFFYHPLCSRFGEIEV